MKGSVRFVDGKLVIPKRAETRAIPQLIGSRDFPSKTALKEEVRRILYSTSQNQPLAGLDFILMRDLIDQHPDAWDIVGEGIHSIFIDESGFQKEVCFYVLQEDETIRNFSFHKCIDGQMTPWRKFSRACRVAVRPDIKKFKDEFFKNNPDPVCEVLGTKLINDSTSHVDHEDPEFNDIVFSFSSYYDLDIDIFTYKPSTYGVDRFEDDYWDQEFCSFHDSAAELRVISAKANLSRGSIVY